jgi:hypothetical protein
MNPLKILCYDIVFRLGFHVHCVLVIFRTIISVH